MPVALDEIAVLRERLRTDTPFWARHCATILTKDKRAVRLEAFPWQARTPDTPAHVTPLDEALEKQRLAGMPMRAIVLKARQLGFSTWVQAKAMQRVSQMPHQYALVAAHKRRAASNLMDMANRIYENLPTDRELALLLYGTESKAPPFSIRPQKIGEGQTRAGNRWMTMGERARRSEESIYETMTAGAKGDGRASTPTFLHGSEVAHYEDPNFLGGVLNAVPKLPETIVVLESTANGFNHFHERWQRAVEGAEDPETGGLFVPLFYGWQDNPFNAMAFISDQARDRFEKTIGDPDGGGDEEEPWLIEEFGCTLEQLRWRRVTIAEECGGDIDTFHQEHPATAQQAFVGSGRPVFPAILVTRAISEAARAPEPVEGVLRAGSWVERRTRAGSVMVPRDVGWVPMSLVSPEDRGWWGDGKLLVWEHPVNAVTQAGLEAFKRGPDGQYVVFADVAIGADGTAGVGDWHAVQVLDHVTRMQVARYRSRIPVHDLPLVLFLIASYFNEAWLAPEVNGPGQGVIDVLHADLRYPRLYRRHRRGDDQRQDAQGYLLGWQTTLPTKSLMEQTFGLALKEGSHGLRDEATGREATTYVRDPKNPAKHGAQRGAHDDLLMAMMGVHRVAAELRPRDPNKTRKVRGRRVDDSVTGY